jgi:cytochrome P450
MILMLRVSKQDRQAQMVAENISKCLPSGEPGPIERKASPPENTFAASHARNARKVVRIEKFDLARQVLLSDGVKQAGFMADVVAHFTAHDHPPVLFQEGEAHHKQRAATAHLFSPSVVTARYRELIKTYSGQLISTLRETGSARLDVLALELAVAVTADVVGLTESPASELTRRLSCFFAVPPLKGGVLAKLTHFMTTSYCMLRFFIRDVRPSILARRAKRQDDLISHLIDQNYSARDILTEAITYGAAGIATTRELIVMGAWHLFENQR